LDLIGRGGWKENPILSRSVRGLWFPNIVGFKRGRGLLKVRYAAGEGNEVLSRIKKKLTSGQGFCARVWEGEFWGKIGIKKKGACWAEKSDTPDL